MCGFKTKVIEGLPLNYNSTNPKDFVEVLNKIADAMGGVPNMGAFVDITSVTQTNKMVAKVEDKYVVVSTKQYERPYRDYIVTTNVVEPWQFDLDTLVGKNELINGSESFVLQSEKPESSVTIRGNNGTWETVDVCTNSGLLDGTIENNECNPLEDCPECRGDRTCNVCHGSGSVNCRVCHGDGRCRVCNGQGRIKCNECFGSGRCRHCGGSGQIVCKNCHGNGVVYDGRDYVQCRDCGGGGYEPCIYCSSTGISIARIFFGASSYAAGSGKCHICNGTGALKCKTCGGMGNCTSCQGSGRETCSCCNGDGNCPNCHGSGKVTCRRCAGSGWYQTFKFYYAKCYVKKWEYMSNEELKEGLKIARKHSVYKDTYRKWRFKDVIGFDKIEDVKQKSKCAFGSDMAFQTFERAYEQKIRVSGEGTPYEKAIEIEKVPLTQLDFTLNEKDYSVFVMGDNGVVMCKELPVKVEMYKPTFVQKLKMTFTKKKRHRAYIKMAAYIFQCDGKSVDESHVLDVFITALKMKPAKQEEYKEQLKKFDSSMPYEVFRKEVKVLFSSKKTLTFAWQCMAVEKNVSLQENELFAKLVAEYKIDSSEVEKIKKFAAKYSLLKDEYLVAEYLGK